MSEDNYEVGYKKPPVSYRFQKGQSGNPKGRPKKSKTHMTILEQINKELERVVTIRENGKLIKVTKMGASIKNLVANAMKGDTKAMALLMKITPELEEAQEKSPQLVQISWMD